MGEIPGYIPGGIILEKQTLASRLCLANSTEFCIFENIPKHNFMQLWKEEFEGQLNLQNTIPLKASTFR